jgi:hypothetical protein
VGFKSPAEDLKGYKRLRRKGAAFSSLAPTYGMMPRRSRFLYSLAEKDGEWVRSS